MHTLDVFDFDGTLFRTPLNTHENRRKYEKAKGIPWLIDKKLASKLTRKLGYHVGMRRGWWGRKETLEPPITPDPTPPEFFIPHTYEAFLDSKRNSKSLTIMLTGRYLGLQHHVLRILGDGGLVKVERDGDRCTCIDPDVVCLFLGDNGPKPTGAKPHETLPWKLWILEQYVNMYDETLDKIEIWEDRTEHVKAFRDHDWGIQVIVNHITERGE
jgi:hypothetical protein